MVEFRATYPPLATYPTPCLAEISNVHNFGLGERMRQKHASEIFTTAAQRQKIFTTAALMAKFPNIPATYNLKRFGKCTTEWNNGHLLALGVDF